MDTILVNVNWLAVVAGTIAAVALAMLWFGRLFGRAWAAGSHGITPPERFPVLAMGLHIAGVFLMAVVIGATATIDALVTAIIVILAIAALMTGSALFSQKSTAAALIDGGYVIAAGIVMILAQAIF